MGWPHSLRSLRHRNVRLFAMGQGVSLLGTWMQNVAMGWLVYRLTGSAQMLGLIAFLTQVPTFLLGAWAGSLADRVERRKLMFAAQSLALVQAVLLAILTVTGAVQPWHLVVLATMLGVSTAVEVPARHSLLAELAGPDTPNAVALNSTIVNGTRMVGPAIGGLLVAWVGEAVCFALNAASFAAVLFALSRMEIPARIRSAGTTSLWDGARFAWGQPMIRTLLVMLLLVSFVAFPFQSLLPLVVGEVLRGGPALLGQLGAAFGAGALISAVVLLRRTTLDGLGRRIAVGASALAVGLIALAVSRNPWASALALVVVGFGFLLQGAGTLTLLQHLTPDAMRGRVLGLFTMIFIGATPFGALLAGWVASQVGVSLTLLAAGGLVLAASAGFHVALPAAERATAPPAAARPAA